MAINTNITSTNGRKISGGINFTTKAPATAPITVNGINFPTILKSTFPDQIK